MLLSSSEAYRLWAADYDSTPNPLLALEARHISAYLNGMQAGTAVDVGCGTGRCMGKCLDRRVQVIGIDRSIDMLAQASQKSRLRGRLILSDASDLPLQDAIADVVLCCFAISYFSDLRLACSEMARIAKLSGRLIVSDLHPATVERGWRRSFRVGSNTYDIQHAIYSDRELESTLYGAGWRELLHIDAAFSERDRSHFASAGK